MLGQGAVAVALIVSAVFGGASRVDIEGDGVERSFVEQLRRDGVELCDRFQVPRASVVVGAAGRAEELALCSPGHDGADDVVFEVASLSKTATALAVMVLVEEGKLALDDPVGRHLTRWQFPSDGFDVDGVTVRRLLSHTAGLPLGVPASSFQDARADDQGAPPLVEVLDGVHGHVPARVESEPGSGFEYSNPGYGVLELLIEEVTGQPYSESMRHLVFAPLGMSATGFADDTELAGRVVEGYRSAGQAVVAYQRVPRAAGGMLSTASDMAKLVRALLSPATEGGLLSEGGLAEMNTVPAPATGAFGLGDDGGYAFGLAAGTLPSGQRFIANNGSHEGYNALFVAVPHQGDYMVVLTNAETGIGLELEVALRWFDEVIGERPSIATTFLQIRRAVGVSTVGLLAVLSLVLGRQVFQVLTGRRTRATQLQVRRFSFRTLPLLMVAAAAVIGINTGAVTSDIGGLPPARLVSDDYSTRVLVLATLLAAIGIIATAAPTNPGPRRRG